MSLGIPELHASRLTALRAQASLSVAEAAAILGLTTRALQYLEDHTKRLPPEAFAAYRVRLEPIRFEHMQPISIWEWLAEHDSMTTADEELL